MSRVTLIVTHQDRKDIDVEAPVTASSKRNSKSSRELLACQAILKELVHHELAEPFLTPVNTKEVHLIMKLLTSPKGYGLLDVCEPSYRPFQDQR